MTRQSRVGRRCYRDLRHNTAETASSGIRAGINGGRDGPTGLVGRLRSTAGSDILPPLQSTQSFPADRCTTEASQRPAIKNRQINVLGAQAGTTRGSHLCESLKAKVIIYSVVLNRRLLCICFLAFWIISLSRL